MVTNPKLDLCVQRGLLTLTLLRIHTHTLCGESKRANQINQASEEEPSSWLSKWVVTTLIDPWCCGFSLI